MSPHRTLPHLLILLATCLGGAGLPAQAPEGEPAPPAPDPTRWIGRSAPAFDLEGTGDRRLGNIQAKAGPLVVFFLGDLDRVLIDLVHDTCRDRHELIENLHGQLALVGPENPETYQELLGRRPARYDIFTDLRNELQEQLDLDTTMGAWMVTDTSGVIVDLDTFLPSSDQSRLAAIDAVAAALRSLILKDAPNFITLLGKPIDRALDMITMPDGTIYVLTGRKLLSIIGTENREIELPDEISAQSFFVDNQGLVYMGAGEQIWLFMPPDAFEIVLDSPGEATGPITAMTTHSSAAIIFLRGGRLAAMLPASQRVVPLDGAETGGVIDLLPAVDDRTLILRSQPPYLQLISTMAEVETLKADEKIDAPPVAATIDAGGRIFLALSGRAEILVVDSGGKVQASFPCRGGGVEGEPRIMSTGGGYLDVLARDKATGKLRVMRFAL